MYKNDKTKYKDLCDTGASSTVIGEKLANFEPITFNNSPKIFTTAMGNFTNEFSSELTFQLPELSNSLELTWQCDVVKDLSNTPYDMIIGRDVLKELKIDVLTSDLTVTREHIKIPQRPRDSNEQFNINAEEQDEFDEASKRLRQILEAKYEPADLDKMVAECDLNADQKIGLLQLLQKYDELFDGTLGTFGMEPYEL